MSWLMLTAYCVGALLIITGAVGFAIDIELAGVQSTPTTTTAKYALGPFFMIFGSLICVATRLRYRGGLWFIFGAFLIEGAFMGTVSIVEGHLRGWYYVSPYGLYARLLISWIVGSAFLVFGHRRHRKRLQMQPDTALEPTASPPLAEAHADIHACSDSRRGSAWDRR